MGLATFWAMFSQSHLVTLAKTYTWPLSPAIQSVCAFSHFRNNNGRVEFLCKCGTRNKTEFLFEKNCPKAKQN
jgi:hypothetical protein